MSGPANDRRDLDAYRCPTCEAFGAIVTEEEPCTTCERAKRKRAKPRPPRRRRAKQ